jgi:hypothetical protein
MIKITFTYFTGGVFRYFKKFLVSRHDASYASKNQHDTISVEDRRSRYTVTGVELMEYKCVTKRGYANVDTGNYNGPILKIKKDKIIHYCKLI